MRNNLLAMLGITLSLAALTGSVMAIPNSLPQSEVKELGNADITSLWTAHPVSVDPSKQHFERLPARVVELTESEEMSSGVDTIVTGSVQYSKRSVRTDVIDDGGLASLVLSTSHGTGTDSATWCSERYRSYRASDNSYQPYSGARRQCEPPFIVSMNGTETTGVKRRASDIGEIDFFKDIHAQWCFARYRSYNTDNNTYRAFSGEIRSCVSPHI